MSEQVKLTHDEKVQLLFAKLQAKKAEVANAEKPQYLTGGQFRYSEVGSGSVDIVTARKEEKLVEILAFLKDRSKAYAQAAEELGVVATFTWLGFTVEEWTTDLKTRVSILQLSKRKAELLELESRLNAIVSPELRRQMETDALEALLA
jgi:hypothetical protein